MLEGLIYDYPQQENMKISKTEFNRFQMPNILTRINHTKKVISNLLRRGRRNSEEYYLYQIKREMLQIRKHIAIMDEYIRRAEREFKSL